MKKKSKLLNISQPQYWLGNYVDTEIWKIDGLEDDEDENDR